MDTPLRNTEFVIVDVETTGLSPQMGDRICEIAAMRVKGKKIVSTFQSLVNPQRSISYGAYEVNHISDDMVKDAPEFNEILPRFMEFIQDTCLVGYNVNFDLGFIRNELSMLGSDIPLTIGLIDVLRMARRLLPDAGRYPLWHVAQVLKISMPQKHRAFGDVELTKEVFDKLLDILLSKGVDTFSTLHNLFGVNHSLNVDLNNRKLATIQEAIDLEVTLAVKYFSSGRAQMTERQVTPKEIKRERDSYFLKGFCHLRNEERSFKVDRIIDVEIV
ncbi:exonuclease domain-containing protein [Candidatus Omnitrophota bacterium]